MTQPQSHTTDWYLQQTQPAHNWTYEEIRKGWPVSDQTFKCMKDQMAAYLSGEELLDKNWSYHENLRRVEEICVDFTEDFRWSGIFENMPQKYMIEFIKGFVRTIKNNRKKILER